MVKGTGKLRRINSATDRLLFNTADLFELSASTSIRGEPPFHSLLWSLLFRQPSQGPQTYRNGARSTATTHRGLQPGQEVSDGTCSQWRRVAREPKSIPRIEKEEAFRPALLSFPGLSFSTCRASLDPFLRKVPAYTFRFVVVTNVLVNRVRPGWYVSVASSQSLPQARRLHRPSQPH